MGRRVIGVTGLFGAWTNQVAFRLEEAGGSIVWPGQDLRVADAESKYVQNGENTELLCMHQLILDECKLEWFTTSRPRFYDRPYPGPAEYLSRFPDDRPAILVDTKLCFFLPLWQNYMTDLVVIRVSNREVEDVLKTWVPHASRKDRTAVIDNYRESLEGDIGLVDKVWYIENSELKVDAPFTFTECTGVGKENYLAATLD